jgi:3-keto-5-aminohexanoate cleavage enzyme
MMETVIITAALTGSRPTKMMNSAVPYSPMEIADAAIACREAGAAIVHVHVRDPETGDPSSDLELFRETTVRIRDACDVLINLTTSGFHLSGSNVTERRLAVIELKPELCSFDIGSLNFHDRAFVNPPNWGRIAAERMQAEGVKPEIEVFEVGHIAQARHWIDQGWIDRPPFFQMCLGIHWGMPASLENLRFMLNQLPPDSEWSLLAGGKQPWSLLAEGIALGGHIRVGFEDHLHLHKGVLAESNAQLVAYAVDLAKAHGRTPASPEQARAILSIHGKCAPR